MHPLHMEPSALILPASRGLRSFRICSHCHIHMYLCDVRVYSIYIAFVSAYQELSVHTTPIGKTTIHRKIVHVRFRLIIRM